MDVESQRKSFKIGAVACLGSFENQVFVNIFNKMNALGTKCVDNNLIVNNLVVAVDRRVKRSHHPRESFDRHFDSSTKATWLGKQNPVNRHGAFRLARGQQR